MFLTMNCFKSYGFCIKGFKMEPKYYYQQFYCMMTMMVVLTTLFEIVSCRLPLPEECPEVCSCNEITLKVNCSFSDLTSMPQVPNNTRILAVDGNHINVVEKGFFAYMNNLRKLSLANNQMDEMEETSFKNQKKLVHLDISGNLLGEVPVALNDLRILKYLVLKRNQIRTLSKEPWSNLTKLSVLMLDYNNIPNLPLVMTSKLQRLTSLSASNNEIKAIPQGQFLNATDLLHLDLSYNQIKTKSDSANVVDYNYIPYNIPTAATDQEYYVDDMAEGISIDGFKGLVNLKELNLVGNMIHQLENGIFSDLHSLEILNVDSNGLEHIQDMVFREQYMLQVLTMSENALVELPQTIFEDLRDLQVLRLDNNQLIDISPLTNVHMFDLRSLYLNDNQIHSIDLRGFELFKSIEEIFLQNNKLKHVPEVRNLSSLQHLDLSTNKIKKIKPVNAFEGTNLVSINLADNRLESIDQATFVSLANLASLSLEGNAYICDCRLLWVIDYYDQYSWLQEQYPLRPVENQIMCQSPPIIQNVDLAYGNIKQRGLFCTEYIEHHNVLMLVSFWGGIVAFFLALFWTYTYFDFKRRFYVRIPSNKYLLLHNSDKMNNTSVLTENNCKVRFRSYDSESESYICDEITTV